MPYSLVSRDGKLTVHFESEPDYIIGLQMEPARQEPFLASSIWLILAVATWSVKDLDVITKVVAITKEFGGTFCLGVRPFAMISELHSWLPDVPFPEISLSYAVHRKDNEVTKVDMTPRPDQTPILLWLCNGELVAKQSGITEIADIRAFVEHAYLLEE